jgi:hypothetical protein
MSGTEDARGRRAPGVVASAGGATGRRTRPVVASLGGAP